MCGSKAHCFAVCADCVACDKHATTKCMMPAGRGAKSNTTIVGPLNKHLSFSYTAFEGMRLVGTEYVMLVQHDRAFCSGLDVSSCLSVMEKDRRVRYVGFQSCSTNNYIEKLTGKYG